MARSLTADRRNRMAQKLLKEGSIKVGDISKLFGVSTETVRKDIIYLEKQGIAEKNHGGAIAKVDLAERTLDEKEWVCSREKAAIATAALALIPAGSSVILDTGSTTNAIAKQLVLRHGLTVFTNSVITAGILAESDHDVFLFGGYIRHSSKAAVGDWALNALTTIHADLAFLGSDGYKGLTGPSTLSYEEAAFKKGAIAASAQTFVVADSSKSQGAGRFEYCRWGAVAGLITDRQQEEGVIKNINDETVIHFA
jgi:DeoR family transcriptional regulator of aga operon